VSGWLPLLLLIAGTGWIWYSAMAAREAANEAARELCGRLRLRLLDDTVALARIRPVRSPLGQWRLRRHYVFDYTDDGARRLQGFIVLMGRNVESSGLAGADFPAGN
jgi:hypothetical protein